MEQTSYKDFKTSRGINYHYFVSKAKGAKPTILFAHGFPSTSLDWKSQVLFFSERGYGVIAPDLLGYGGTDKPTDTNSYRMKLMCQDIVDILGHEKVDNVAAVGHDWGSFLVSYLAIFHPTRFIAFGFLAVGYIPTDFDPKELIKVYRNALGYDIFGYMLFFAEADADKVIEEHFDSFFSVFFPNDPKLLISNMANVGALKAYVQANKMAPLPSYMTEAGKEERKKLLLGGGLRGPLGWYRAAVEKVNTQDRLGIKEDDLIINHPIFFGAASQDYICLAATGIVVAEKYCTKATIVDFDTDHWVQLAAPEKLNHELLKWIEGIKF